MEDIEFFPMLPSQLVSLKAIKDKKRYVPYAANRIPYFEKNGLIVLASNGKYELTARGEYQLIVPRDKTDQTGYV